MRTFDRSTTAIRVQVGERFALSLKAQPTAGYAWRVAAGEPCLALALEEQIFEPAGPALGAAGRERLVFRAQRAGRCQLALVYGRPWEGTPRDRHTLEVEVEPETHTAGSEGE